MAFAAGLDTVHLPRNSPMSRSVKSRPIPWDPFSLGLAVFSASLVAVLGWGVEQWRLSDQEVPVHTARLHAYP
jgi:hypothetical protein